MKCTAATVSQLDAISHLSQVTCGLHHQARSIHMLKHTTSILKSEINPRHGHCTDARMLGSDSTRHFSRVRGQDGLLTFGSEPCCLTILLFPMSWVFSTPGYAMVAQTEAAAQRVTCHAAHWRRLSNGTCTQGCLFQLSSVSQTFEFLRRSVPI